MYIMRLKIWQVATSRRSTVVRIQPKMVAAVEVGDSNSPHPKF